MVRAEERAAYDDDDRRIAEMRHSRMGIASFVLSVLVVVLLFLVLPISFGLSDFPESSEDMTAEIMGVLSVTVSLLVGPVALGLGVAGMARRRSKKKLFAVLGTVISGVSVASLLLLMSIGFSA